MNIQRYEKKLISVLIPVYNVEAYIERCLVSLFESSYAKKTHFILCDDASTDNTLKVAESICLQYMDLEITLLKNESNQGVARTRNKLIDTVCTDYFIFVDSDDWVEIRFLDCLYENAIFSHADVLYYTKYYQRKNNITNVIQQATVRQNPDALHILLKDEIKGNLWIHLLKTSLIRQNSIKFSEKLGYGEDLFFLVKCYFHATTFIPIDETLYNYNKNNENSITNSEKNRANRFTDSQFFLKEIKEYLEKMNCFFQFESAYMIRCLLCYFNVMTNGSVFQKFKYRNSLGAYKRLPLKVPFDKHFHNKLITYCYANHMFFIALFIQMAYKILHKIRKIITPPPTIHSTGKRVLDNKSYI